MKPLARRTFALGLTAALQNISAGADNSTEYPYATDAIVKALEAYSVPRLHPHSVVIHDPPAGTYQYAHHPQITYCFGQFLAMWSSGIEREDRPGQRILWSRSGDGMTWSKPEIMFECPEPPWRLTAAGWAVEGGRLYAYVNRNRRPESETLHPGLIWYPPLYVDVMEASNDLRWSAPRTVDSDLVANESPRRTSAGTWLLAGYTARLESGVLRSCAGPASEYVFHPAPRVLIPKQEWTRPRMTPPQRPLGEPSWYERNDKSLVCLFRDDAASFHLYASISVDDGVTWSTPRRTNIPDAKSKNAARVLANGVTIVVSNACVPKKRNALTVLVSRGGKKFDRGLLLRGDEQNRYSYPGIVEHEQHLWVIYSINKHRIAVSSFPVKDLA